MRSAQQQAFSLVELMVALSAGMVVIASVYTLSAGAARHFHEQQRIAQTQTGVRLAMNRLQHDLSRAGFGGTPNLALEQGQACGAVGNGINVPIQAIRFLPNEENAQLPNAANNPLARADRLYLMGNYSTSDGYLLSGTNLNHDVLYLQATSQAFIRTFRGNTTLQNIFLGGAVYIISPNGNHFVRRVIATSDGSPAIAGNGPAIQLAGALPGAPCFPGLGAGTRMFPLSHIEYVISSLEGAANQTMLSTLSPGDNLEERGLAPSVLIRREVGFDANRTPVANTAEVILEFAVVFQLDFWADNRAANANTPLLELLPLASAGAVNTKPERLRQVRIRLAKRTADADTRFPFIVSNTWPMTRYQPQQNNPAASRVRALETEVFLRNIAVRNLPQP